MSTGRRSDDRWLRRFGSCGPADLQLFCFHHAGGSAALYRRWAGLLPAGIEPVAVQLPGRADRLREPALQAMWPLVDTLVEVLEPLLERPFAFYGLSMGGKTAWALAHRLRERSHPMPVALFLASVAAPACAEGPRTWDDTGELLAYLQAMGGTPPEIFAEPELLAAVLPTVRADLNLVDSFDYRPSTPLDVRIRAFVGADDAELTEARMAQWRQETRGPFRLDTVTGGHFFDDDGERRVVGMVAADLEQGLAR